MWKEYFCWRTSVPTLHYKSNKSIIFEYKIKGYIFLFFLLVSSNQRPLWSSIAFGGRWGTIRVGRGRCPICIGRGRSPITTSSSHWIYHFWVESRNCLSKSIQSICFLSKDIGSSSEKASFGMKQSWSNSSFWSQNSSLWTNKNVFVSFKKVKCGLKVEG